MMRPIGYYVHHQGNGHLQRALNIAANSAGRVVLLGTGLAGRTGNVSFVDLADDRADSDFSGKDGARSRPLTLHYAPLHHDGVRQRMSIIAKWIAAERPSLFVVDVSVEIAMLARLCSIPVAYVRLSGIRDDPAHLETFRLAKALIAPFDERLDDPEVAEWVRAKTVFCPGLVTPSNHLSQANGGTVLVVKGMGGQVMNGNALAAAARFVPDKIWRLIGPCSVPDDCPGNLELVGWVSDPANDIAGAEIVIGAAGDGLVSQVLVAARPFICIPEDRPYDEQRTKAAALKRCGVAVVLDEWPATVDWPHLFASAKTLDLREVKKLGGSNGGMNAYSAIQKLVDC